MRSDVVCRTTALCWHTTPLTFEWGTNPGRTGDRHGSSGDLGSGQMTKSTCFDERVAIVTGAAGGLGRSCALDLTRRGAHVVVNDLGATSQRSPSAAALAVVQKICAAGGTAIADGTDVTDRAQADAGTDLVTPAVAFEAIVDRTDLHAFASASEEVARFAGRAARQPVPSPTTVRALEGRS